jgi:hypothetical protein
VPGIEPGPPRLAPRTVLPPYWWRITDQLRPIRNGQGDGICTRTVRVTGGDANYYITTLMKWGPWSDSHRRIRVYETRPVAAEAQGLKMVSTTGIAPVTSGFARRRSDLTELRGLLA